MVAFDEIQDHADDLIRKGLQGSVFIQSFGIGDPEITSLTDATGLLALPPGLVDVGRITKDDGVGWTRDIESSDVMSLGAGQPTRRDVTSDITGLTFTAQESKRTVFELYEGQDLSGVVQSSNGNVSWDKPDRPATLRYRVFVLFKDGEGADAFYFAKWLPRAEVTDRGEQAWNEEDELQYQITMTAYVDNEVGTSIRSLWAASPAALTRMGFPAA